ncbi:UDP-glucuronosyltransferase 3A2 [Blattella germanica]|nr:UDP-glucuronosyltransferase 3A2 [Blattella germanica]
MGQFGGRGGGEKQMNTFEMERGYIDTLFFLWSFGNFMCDYYLAQEEMQNLMKSNEKYDLIIQQNFFLDCFLGFSHKFQAPLIQLVTFAGSETMGDVVGNPAPYAYVPDPFSSNGDKMDFMGRLFNTLGQLFQKVGHKLYHMPNQDKIMRKYFKDQYMPYIGDLEKKTALLLVNHHFSLSYPKPMVPNYVQVGGMHVKPPKKLPEDLQKYIDEAPDGVIYFSMGSNLKSSDMSKETVQSFIEAFKSLKQRVLWKWEDDMLPGQPQNLRIQKWFPQSDILAHPNVRLFITHGGLLSTQETFNRGVPIVGIPILGDQRLNMALCENLGCGIKLEFKNITTESILWAVKQVIENPK